VKETKGNTEMENRLLYSPKDVREKRLALLRARGEANQNQEKITINTSSFDEPSK